MVKYYIIIYFITKNLKKKLNKLRNKKVFTVRLFCFKREQENKCHTKKNYLNTQKLNKNILKCMQTTITTFFFVFCVM